MALSTCDQAHINRVRNSFLAFCAFIEPEFKFAAHHRFIISTIQEQLEKVDEPRSMFSLPPGHGKSTLICVLLPAFLLGQHPDQKIMILTYGSDLSKSFGRRVRDIITSNVYQQVFPSTVVEGTGKSSNFYTTAGGGLHCAGRGGAITGFRANIILADDTLKNDKEAKSEAILRELWTWWTKTAYTRKFPKAAVFILATRWTTRDLIGKILTSKTSWKWNYYNLPSISFEEKEDLIGRSPGEALWEEQYPLQSLLEIKDLDEETFETLYQGNPRAKSRQFISNEMVGESVITPEEMAALGDRYVNISSWDTASKTGDNNSYTACTIWRYYPLSDVSVLMAIIQERLEFPALLKAYKRYTDMFQIDVSIVEDANSGLQLNQVIGNTIPGKVFDTEKKYSLADIVAVFLTNGTFRVLRGAMSPDNINQITKYPESEYDDVVLSIFHFTEILTKKSKLLVKKTRSSVNKREYLDKIRKYTSSLRRSKKKTS